MPATSRLLVVCLIAALLAVPSSAQVQRLLAYQGRLLRADGTAATGTTSAMFSLYSGDTGGTPLWSETQTLGLSDGYYSTFLGLVSPASEGLFDGGGRWLEVKVGSEVLAPRQQIGAAPYALTAQRVIGSADVTSLRIAGQTVVDGSGRLAGTARYVAGEGIAIEEAGQTISLRACPSGQILLREDMTWQCATRVAEVSASAPLSVTNGATTPQIAMTQAGTGVSGFLSSTDWAAFNAKFGALTQCGGDLAGNLAAPVVTRLQSRTVSANPPGNGQALKWTAATSQWEPSPDADSGGTVTLVTVDAPLSAYDGATTPRISMAAATGSVDGYLSSTDWSRFEAKYDASTQCVGDLAGTLGNPLVAKLRGVSVATATPTAAQVLRFDGNAWTPATLATSDVSGLAGNLSNLNASNLVSGWVPDGRLASTYAQAVSFTSASNTFAGNGAGLTGLDATNIATGTLADGRLASAYSQAVSFTNASNSFTGNGSGLTALDAGRLTTGTVADGRLASSYSQAISFTNSSNAFTGNGSGLTSLNAAQLSGTVPSAALAGTYSNVLVFSNASNAFQGTFAGTFAGGHTGTFSGDGSALTSLPAGNLSGTLPSGVLSASGVVVSGSTPSLGGLRLGSETGTTCTSANTGAIRWDGTHFQGCTGTFWSNLDNVPPPIVTSARPSVGTTAGGTLVSIDGDHFQALASVSIGGAAATSVQVVNSGLITAVTPASATEGVREVKVTNTDFLSGALASAFTYDNPPTVATVTPAGGPANAASTITIAGTYFRAGATVTVGGAAVTVSSVSSGQIVASVASAAAGAKTVTVTNTDALAASLSSGFTHYTPGSDVLAPAASCQTILSSGWGSTSGTYWIDVDGAGALTPFQVYCDQTNASGGWIKVTEFAESWYDNLARRFDVPYREVLLVEYDHTSSPPTGGWILKQITCHNTAQTGFQTRSASANCTAVANTQIRIGGTGGTCGDEENGCFGIYQGTGMVMSSGLGCNWDCGSNQPTIWGKSYNCNSCRCRGGSHNTGTVGCASVGGWSNYHYWMFVR